MTLRDTLKAALSIESEAEGEMTSWEARKLLDIVEEVVHANETPYQRPLVQVPSGVILDTSRINFITMKELNQYVAFYPNMANAPFLTGADLDVLREYGVIQRLLPTAKAAEREQPKIAVA